MLSMRFRHIKPKRLGRAGKIMSLTECNLQTKECELPFEISAVHQSHLNTVDDELMVCSKDGVWYFAKFSENEVTCYPLTSEIDLNGNWVFDQAAGAT